MRTIEIATDCLDSTLPRIGGGAFIGGIKDWPKTAAGEALTLVASLPLSAVNDKLDASDGDIYISVFSYYSVDDYFLDEITYHGNTEERSLIERTGSTRVLLHSKGELVYDGCAIEEREIVFKDKTPVSPWHGSGLGQPPGFLQNENMTLPEMKFILQLYSADFPSPYKDIFGLSDALGYLYVNNNQDGGLFFVQVT